MSHSVIEKKQTFLIKLKNLIMDNHKNPLICGLCTFTTGAISDLEEHLNQYHVTNVKRENQEVVDVKKENQDIVGPELGAKPKRKPFVPTTDGWKRFMDSNVPKTVKIKSSKKESEGWKRFM